MLVSLAFLLQAEMLWAEENSGEPHADRRFRSGLGFVDVDGRLTGVASELVAGNC